MRMRAFCWKRNLGEAHADASSRVHLEREYSGWETDCDYNRLGERLLKLPHGSIVPPTTGSASRSFPDIAVHRRAVPENLLAIESGGNQPQPAEHDHHKLRGP